MFAFDTVYLQYLHRQWQQMSTNICDHSLNLLISKNILLSRKSTSTVLISKVLTVTTNFAMNGFDGHAMNNIVYNIINKKSAWLIIITINVKHCSHVFVVHNLVAIT